MKVKPQPHHASILQLQDRAEMLVGSRAASLARRPLTHERDDAIISASISRST
jgi:hypothetical protein